VRPVSDQFLLLMAEVSATLIGLFLVAANVDTVRGMLAVARTTTRATALLVNEIAGTALVVLLVLIPWILGGFHPSREDLTWAILLSFASGFLSVAALMLSVLDIARDEPGSA
jgi:hypothetical protein